MKLKVSFFILVVLVLFVFQAGPAAAQEPDFDRINAVAEKLNCPTCAGINLADCNTLTCQQWRDQISDLIDEGYSNQEILDYFSARYGPQVLQEPPRSGSTLILWVLPVVAILAGVVLLFFTIRSWAGGRTEAVPETEESPTLTTPISDAANVPENYLEEVEKDLERRE